MTMRRGLMMRGGAATACCRQLAGKGSCSAVVRGGGFDRTRRASGPTNPQAEGAHTTSFPTRGLEPSSAPQVKVPHVSPQMPTSKRISAFT